MHNHKTMEGANFENNYADLKMTENKIASIAKYEDSHIEIKKLKTEPEDANEDQGRKSNTRKIFNCGACIADWGEEFGEKWRQSGDKTGIRTCIFEALDSKIGSIQNICTFSSFGELKSHVVEVHDWSHDDFCKEKSCLQYKDHEEDDDCGPGIYIHGDLVCDTCEVTFEDECDLEGHVKLIHENIAQMSKAQVFAGYLIHICGALKSDD